MKRPLQILFYSLTAGFLVGIFGGCDSQKSQPKMNELLGTCSTDTIQTEWGPGTIELTFQNASELEFKFYPTEGEKNGSVTTKGKYRLKSKQLFSEAINKGEPVSIWLEKDQLLLQVPSETPLRFKRK